MLFFPISNALIKPPTSLREKDIDPTKITVPLNSSTDIQVQKYQRNIKNMKNNRKICLELNLEPIIYFDGSNTKIVAVTCKVIITNIIVYKID